MPEEMSKRRRGSLRPLRQGPDGSGGGRRPARVTGLREFATPTLEQVERRRVELLSLVFLVMLALAAGMAFVSTSMFETPLVPDVFRGSLTVLRVSLVLLAASFGVYVWDKDRRLRRVAADLVNERVLSAALTNRVKELEVLGAAGKAVSSFIELDEVLDVILRSATELLGADEGSVQLTDGDDLVVAAGSGHAETFVGQRHSGGVGLSGYVAKSREALLIQGRPGLEDVRSYGASLLPRDERVLSAVSVPLMAKGELLGVLNLNVIDGERRFNEYDLRALAIFGEHAAMAVRHARTLRKERELRLSLIELDQMRAELVGSMTHDLKTPLTAVLGASRLLMDRFDAIDPEMRTELMASIENQAKRLLSLIERLLDAARSGASQPLSPGPIDLVKRLRPLAASFANAHGREIHVEGETEVIAYADPDAVDQIVANLLENAAKYAPGAAPIRVRIRHRGRRAEISVIDQGPGIPGAEREHLFEAFRRGNPRAGGGAGLGLFIVANLVRAMGGDVTLDSVPGTGAAFRITLPVEPAQVEAAAG